MNYKKIHDNIIDHFLDKYGSHEHNKGRPIGAGLFNHHHIIPKHVYKQSGVPLDDSPTNLVWLPYKWHRLVHKLLYKIHGSLSDRVAYTHMYGINEEAKISAATAGGRANKSKPKSQEHNRKVSIALRGNTNGKANKGAKRPKMAPYNNELLLDIETNEVRKRSSWIGSGLYRERKNHLIAVATD